MRNKSLDAAKAVAAFMVVCIHVSFPGLAGEIIKVLARCAVPFFFMVSGYFCYYERGNTANKIPAKILHILKLFMISAVFYLIWECFMKSWDGERIQVWLKEVTGIEHLKEFLIYNSTSSLRAHLWFLPALAWCYIIVFFIEKLKLRKVAYGCIPVLLVLLLWRAEFCRLFGGFYHTMEYRNFLFTGMSFFLTGQMIHENQEKLLRKLMNKSGGTKEWIFQTGMVSGAVLGILEYYFQGAREIYVGNCIAVISLFIWLALYGKEKRIPAVMAELGKKYAFLIYLLHPAVSDLMKRISVFLKISGSLPYLCIRPFLVYTVTLLTVCGIYTIIADR